MRSIPSEFWFHLPSIYRSTYWDKEPYLAATDSTPQYAIEIIHQTRDSYHNESSQLSLQDLVLPVYEEAIRSLYGALCKNGRFRIFDSGAYEYMEWSKAAILHQAIRASGARQVLGIPDSLLEKEQDLGLQQALWEEELTAQQESGAEGEKLIELRQKLWEFQQANDSLQDVFARDYPEYFRLKYQNEVASILETQAHLPDDQSVLVEYFWGSQHLFIIAFSRDHLFHHSVRIDSALIGALSRVRSIVSDGGKVYNESDYSLLRQQFTDHSHELYQRLLDPVLQSFGDIRQLVIVPDGRLNYLPFEILLSDCPKSATSFKRSSLPFS